jgi:O-acetyl-ADP-ribose deacetylase (regulator of RNase III)
MINLIRGNLLDAEVEVLVNTVNTVGVMGRGIALQFKTAFPENFREYARACKANELKPGGILTHARGGFDLPRYIINVATKEHWRGNSRMEFIERGLSELVRELQRLGARSVAVPPLGCGLGGLQWEHVYPRIVRAFEALPNVRVLVYEPSAPATSERVRNRAAPNMTAGRAVILALMQRYLATGYEYVLSLLEIQKLAYFMQEAGQPLRLAFKKLHYGPYAEGLQKVLHHIDGHFIEGMADGTNKPTTELNLLPNAAHDAQLALDADEQAKTRVERVGALIDGFDTPFGMELLATVHWVAKHESPAATTSRDAFSAIQSWNARKAKLIKEGHVEAAWKRLSDHGWL